MSGFVITQIRIYENVIENSRDDQMQYILFENKYMIMYFVISLWFSTTLKY